MALTNAERQRRWRDKRNDLAEQAIHENDSDREVVRKIVDAIGAERARALVGKMGSLITAIAGKEPLPDCPLCEGKGHVWINVYGPCGFKENTAPLAAPCQCTRRKRGDNLAELYDYLRSERERLIAVTLQRSLSNSSCASELGACSRSAVAKA